ncbi:hypothetical protein GCM10011379_27520 [Filimonas zeae]|uniref:Uncharacterized protein n=2 Tax=Filimonas zeae TaxID=1737353 RepID=A0A917MWE7_9BACT|nr:hypothetical protein GCM10011379_27520 [Filimonas zeae]
MKPLNFIKTREQNLFVYNFFYDRFQNPIIEKSWSGLYEKAPYEEDEKNPYYNFAINNNLAEDNIIYITLVWQLLKSKTAFAIPNYYRDEAKDILNKAFHFIKWEYDLEYEHMMTEPQDNGFVKSRSCITISPEPSSWEQEHKHLAGLFEIEKYQDIIGLELATFGDASSEITFFGLDNYNLKLVNQLSTNEKPTLDEILGERDIFIDLLIGQDMGYYSCITIKAKEDIWETLNTLTIELYKKGLNYEQNLHNIESIDDFATEMKTIINL